MNDLKEKLFANSGSVLKFDPALIVSAISLKHLEAFIGYEPITPKVSEFSSEYDAPQLK